jgi:hypothetical protein
LVERLEAVSDALVMSTSQRSGRGIHLKALAQTVREAVAALRGEAGEKK